MPDREEARRRFREAARKSFERSDEAFRVQYADAIKELQALSSTDLSGITPTGVDPATYDRLIAVVKEASRTNLAQADLKSRIESLGDVALGLARKVPSLGSFL